MQHSCTSPRGKCLAEESLTFSLILIRHSGAITWPVADSGDFSCRLVFLIRYVTYIRNVSKRITLATGMHENAVRQTRCWMEHGNRNHRNRVVRS